MKEHKPNEISFDPEKYEDRNEMWGVIAFWLKTLVENDYIATIHEEDFGIVVIKYDYADDSMGDTYPYWINPGEYERMQYQEEDDGEIH